MLSPQPARALDEREAYRLGSEAYVFGFPLIEMARTRFRLVEDPSNPFAFKLNTMFNVPRLAGPSSRNVVAPNSDTLYSVAWLDLRGGPVVLKVPDTEGRYYSMQFLDFYTNTFDYVGRRKTGTKEGAYAIVGPDFSGAPPAGMPIIRSPTPSVWLLGRTLIDTPDELPKVLALMQRYTLSTTDEAPPLKRVPQADPTEPLSVFATINAALAENPPPARDADLVKSFAAIGVGPGLAFDPKALPTEIAKALRRAIEDVDRTFARTEGRPADRVNGWFKPPADLGNYGDKFKLRAAIAKNGLGANTLEESFYYTVAVDADSRPLNGTNRYVLRFDAKDLPPVDAFWSVTMYGPDRFLIDNPIRRYAIGDRTIGLRREKDGALEIHVQHQAPGGDKDANWLPAPGGDFSLMLRAYEPRKPMLDGAYAPPPVRRLP